MLVDAIRIAHGHTMEAMTTEPSNQTSLSLTMGDPLGIGPEVLIKALADPERRERGRFVIYGMGGAMALAAERAGIEPFWSRVPRSSEAATSDEANRANVLLLDYDPVDRGESWSLDMPSVGRATKSGGLSSFMFVEDAIADAAKGLLERGPFIDGIVTAPISKLAWNMAGKGKYPGHTELFSTRLNAKRSRMMFHAPQLRVALATAHIPLMDVRNVLTIGRVFDTIDLAHETLIEQGLASPRIAVCGLNPHAGEGGTMGDEEERLVTPAIDLAQQAGINATGPFPADTIFNAAVQGKYDLVVAMYHDQGLIPVKLLAFEHAVNYTAGLPIVRTSPDHGTAYDIAGANKAHAGSMGAAIDLALTLAQSRAKARHSA